MGGRCVSGHEVRESGPFVSDTSPKCIDREGLKRRRTGTGQDESHFTLETLENMENFTLIHSGARRACKARASGTPYLIKFGNLSSREILVIT